jgi:hypothetical protein
VSGISPLGSWVMPFLALFSFGLLSWLLERPRFGKDPSSRQYSRNSREAVYASVNYGEKFDAACSAAHLAIDPS